MKLRYDSMIRSLVLVRLGQELGTDSELARNVAAVLDLLIHAARSFLG